MTQKQYIEMVKEEVKANKKLINDILKKDKMLATRQKWADKNKLQRYIGSIEVDYKFIRVKESGNFNITTILSFDETLTKLNMENEITNVIENDKIKKFTSGDYREIIDIIVENYTYNVRPVRKNIRLDKIRMKDSRSGLLDGYDKQDWDTNTGRCVFDYIINRYGDIKGFKSICNYEDLNEIFSDNDGSNLLDIGVNTIEIERFCKAYKIPMYALDDSERTFQQYQPEIRNKKCPAMIFRLSNNHFYPVSDKKKIQSIIQTASSIKQTHSDLYSQQKIPEKEGDIKDFDNVVLVPDAMGKLVSAIKSIYQEHGDEADKYIPQKFTMVKKELVSFKLQKKNYVMNPDVEKVKQLCNNMNLEYKGQGVGTIILECVKQATGNERLPKSTHNPYVFKTLLDAKKDRVHYGFVKDFSEDMTDCVAWDINSCYASCMNKPTCEWIRLDYNDNWADYDGVLKLGLYYVRTDDTTLFKKSNYYSTAIIQKAIDEGIDFIIEKQLIPTYTEPKNLLSKVIRKILEYSKEDKKLSKLPINMMSGLLGQSEKTITTCKINKDLDQIFNWLEEYANLGKGIFINKIPETDYFLYGFHKELEFNETNLPMYIQVLDESNIRLYDMVKQMGGELIARKTDLAIVRGIPYKEFREIKWGGYKSEDIPHIAKVEKCEHLDFTTEKDWWDYNIQDSDNWEKIMTKFVEKGGMLLQGNAGNGKTYVAKNIAKALGRVKILAPTNKAALNIGGSTIHTFLKMTKEGYISPKTVEFVKKDYDYIIVDEISMITKELWKRLCLLKKETGIKFLLLGDNKQCPPVENEEIEDYFNHPAVKYLCENNRNVLTVRKRYDKKLYNTLKKVNNIDISKFKKLETTKNICYFNRTRRIINKKWNDIHKKEGDLFIAENNYDEYSQDMYIYEGLPVIACKTKRDGDDIIFANSESFTVGNVDNEYITVWNERPDENGEKEIFMYDCPIEEFRDYFLMNYCSTTHKSQGDTITENFTIYDWKSMTKKLRYTSLSRATCLEQVSFGEVEYVKDNTTFEDNIKKKLVGHLEYDTKKKFDNDICVKDIQELFVKQNGDCIKCECMLKTCNYDKGDKKQFSIDRINSSIGHIKSNIQLLCWGCNRAKKNRF
jgi:adenylate kinase family enzyme